MNFPDATYRLVFMDEVGRTVEIPPIGLPFFQAWNEGSLRRGVEVALTGPFPTTASPEELQMWLGDATVRAYSNLVYLALDRGLLLHSSSQKVDQSSVFVHTIIREQLSYLPQCQKDDIEQYLATMIYKVSSILLRRGHILADGIKRTPGHQAVICKQPNLAAIMTAVEELRKWKLEPKVLHADASALAILAADTDTAGFFSWHSPIASTGEVGSFLNATVVCTGSPSDWIEVSSTTDLYLTASGKHVGLALTYEPLRWNPSNGLGTIEWFFVERLGWRLCDPLHGLCRVIVDESH